MFKTSQPNPDRSKETSSSTNSGKTSPKFKTLEEFSTWLDQQLAILESNHDGFQTSDSVRKFFARG